MQILETRRLFRNQFFYVLGSFIVVDADGIDQYRRRLVLCLILSRSIEVTDFYISWRYHQNATSGSESICSRSLWAAAVS